MSVAPEAEDPEQRGGTVEWCTSCSRAVTAEAVLIDRRGARRCPICRTELATRSPSAETGDVPVEERAKAPWHFKLLLVATAIYLVYRTIWIIQRVTHHG